MIKILKAKNHKAVQQIKIHDLGKVNVLCGKNNSGKSSIFEALSNRETYSIGIVIDDSEILLEEGRKLIDRFSSPLPMHIYNWFQKYITDLVSQKKVIYLDELNEIREDMEKSISYEVYLNSYNTKNAFGLVTPIEILLNNEDALFSPRLIPPKRRLESNIAINMQQHVENNGTGCLNRLFYLKNQDIKSHEYQTYLDIYNAFTQITDCKINIIPNNQNTLTPYYEVNGEWIISTECGLGLSDVLVILIQIIDNENNFIFIEEPENHLHAMFQKKLLQYISEYPEKQFFISTHSSVFLDNGRADKIYYVEYNNEAILSDQTRKATILTELGYSISENITADAIILCEGPTDIPVIREVLKWIGVDERNVVKYWPLGGDIMGSLDLSVFEGVGKIFALIDSDPGSSVIRTRFKRECDEKNIYCKRLKRMAIENYFSVNAVRSIFPERVPKDLEYFSNDIKVDEQLKVKKPSIKTKNGQIIKCMTLSDIKNTDLYQFARDVKKSISNLKDA